ncbi:MAG: bifunctional phosphoserine phosphatase/homoserine phosphotransferase ThrH [Thermodesulfobacteriota bacterium]
MNIICSDLEGVFVPEIWINVAFKTGIEELKLTTRDISDYDVLMKRRLAILKQHGLKITDITAVISTMDPLPGARELLDWIRERSQIIVVSDTFTQFAGPLMKKLGWPTLFCHTLSIAADGSIDGYNLRQPEGKKKTVQALQGLNYRVVAFGDSYNDVGMLQQADVGILFRPPENVIRDYPQFPVTEEYGSLKGLLRKELER